jgi:hypothetical protein
LEYQSPGLLQCKLECEVLREAVRIARDGFVEVSRADAIEAGKVGIEQHAFAAQKEDTLLDHLGGNELAHGI